MSDFKAKMQQIVCRMGLCPRPRVYTVYFVYLYVLYNWPMLPYYKIVPWPMAPTSGTYAIRLMYRAVDHQYHVATLKWKQEISALSSVMFLAVVPFLLTY